MADYSVKQVASSLRWTVAEGIKRRQNFFEYMLLIKHQHALKRFELCLKVNILSLNYENLVSSILKQHILGRVDAENGNSKVIFSYPMLQSIFFAKLWHAELGHFII